MNPPVKISEAVRIFSEFSRSRRFHIRGEEPGGKVLYRKGGKAGGWSREKLIYWEKKYQIALRHIPEDRFLSVLKWYLKHFDDQYTPFCSEFTVFIEKFDQILRAKKRSAGKINGNGHRNGHLDEPVRIRQIDAATGKEKEWKRAEGEYTEEEIERFNAAGEDEE
jgi:hypothetical protein